MTTVKTAYTQQQYYSVSFSSPLENNVQIALKETVATILILTSLVAFILLPVSSGLFGVEKCRLGTCILSMSFLSFNHIVYAP